MKDSYGRNIEYMRVSITDRCDLRCRYCMPDGCEKVSMSQILTYEDIERIVRAAAGLGISRIKITGGEPFARLGCTDLIRKIKAIDGIEQVTLTTNGQSLCRHIEELKEIGIDGINISLDTLKEDRYTYITGRGVLKRTLEAIDASAVSGIKTKVNCLIQKGFNADETEDLAALAWDKGIDVRFIEMMPIGAGDADTGVSNKVVLEQLKSRWSDLIPDDSAHGNGPAVYYIRPGNCGAVGLISAIHGPFCDSCNRIRLTSTGQIKTCLCYDECADLKPYLDRSDAELKNAIYDAVMKKPAAHCFNSQSAGTGSITERRLMSQIGG